MMSNKGQTITPEFVVIFFVALAAIVGTSVYTQRALQARVRDARNYMVTTAVDGCKTALGANCKGLDPLTGKFRYEYETYYDQRQAEVHRNAIDNKILNKDAHASQMFQQVVTHSEGVQRAPWNGD